MDTEKKSSVCSRDFLDLFLYKMITCLYYIAFGPIIGYLALFFKQMGMNSFQVGVVVGIRTFLLPFGAPLAGLLADKYKIRKIIAVLALMVFFGQYLAIFLLKPPRETCMVILLNSTDHPAAFNKTFGEDKQRFKDIFKKQTSDFESQAEIFRRGHHKQTFLPLKKQKITEDDEDEIPHLHEDTATNHTARQARGKSLYTDIEQKLNKFRLSRRLQALDEFEKRSQNQTSLKEYKTIWDKVEIHRYFVYALLIIIIGQPLGGSFVALVDTGVVELLGEKRNDIGTFMLWGAVGMTVSSLLTGAVIQASPAYYYCEVLHQNFHVMFFVLFGFSFLTFFPLFFSKHVYSEETMELKFKSGTCSKLKILFCSIKNATFWITVINLTIFDGIQADFGPWFLDDLGTSPVMIGIAKAMHYACNTATFFVSPYLINWLGQRYVLLLALGTVIVLFLLLSVAQSSWFAIVLFTLTGVKTAFVWSCGVSYVAKVSSPLGIVTTSEGIFHAIYMGLGNSFGSLAGGMGITLLGIRVVFQVLAGLSAFILGTIIILLYIDKKLSVDSSYEPVKTDEDEE